MLFKVDRWWPAAAGDMMDRGDQAATRHTLPTICMAASAEQRQSLFITEEKSSLLPWLLTTKHVKLPIKIFSNIKSGISELGWWLVGVGANQR